MDTQNQVGYFLISVALGVLSGLLYEIFALLRWIFGCKKGKHPKIGFLLDCLFGIFLSVYYITATYFFHFPDLRLYMCLGLAIGFILYAKFLRIMLAFCRKVCYNGIVQMAKRAKSVKKLLKREDLDI